MFFARLKRARHFSKQKSLHRYISHPSLHVSVHMPLVYLCWQKVIVITWLNLGQSSTALCAWAIHSENVYHISGHSCTIVNYWSVLTQNSRKREYFYCVTQMNEYWIKPQSSVRFSNEFAAGKQMFCVMNIFHIYPICLWTWICMSFVHRTIANIHTQRMYSKKEC